MEEILVFHPSITFRPLKPLLWLWFILFSKRFGLLKQHTKHSFNFSMKTLYFIRYLAFRFLFIKVLVHGQGLEKETLCVLVKLKLLRRTEVKILRVADATTVKLAKPKCCLRIILSLFFMGKIMRNTIVQQLPTCNIHLLTVHLLPETHGETHSNPTPHKKTGWCWLTVKAEKTQESRKRNSQKLGQGHPHSQKYF